MKKVILLCSVLLLLFLCALLASCGDGHIHTYGAWTVTRQASCTASGEQMRTCVCGEVETQEIAAGHTEGIWFVVKEPTVWEEGARHLPCAVCKTVLDVEVLHATGTPGLAYVINEDGVTCSVAGVGTSTATSISIPKYIEGYEVTAVADAAFCRSPSLGYVKIADGVQRIGKNAFFLCRNLYAIDIPDSVTAIGARAFDGCEALSNITLPKDLDRIEEQTFAGCAALKKIRIPDGVTEICTDAFNGCTSLTQVTMPDALLRIAAGAFRYCTTLASVDFPAGLQVIGDAAFSDCFSLTGVAIPQSVQAIGNGAFDSCLNIRTITVEEGNKAYRSSGNCLIEKQTGSLVLGCAESQIPRDGSVTSIGSRAFYGCALLEEIYIPDGITVIGEEAFFECTSLFNILHLSNTLITVERGAFLATGITSLYLPDGVTTIGNSAFYGTALTEVSIPASVTIVDDSAFGCCYGLSRVEYRGTKAEWLAVRRGAWWITAPSYTVVCEDGELIKG